MDKVITIIKFIAIAIPCFFIATGCHELGHVITGLLNKWKFVYFTTGPLTVYRENINSKIKVTFTKDLMSWFGFSATIPDNDRAENGDVFAKILIGGPIGSFVTSLIFLALYLLTRTDFCALTAMFAAGQGFATALPVNVRTGAVNNDGMRFRYIRKGGKKGAEEKAAFLIAVKRMISPESPSDEALIRTLTESEDVITRFGGLSYAKRNAALTGDKERLASLETQIALIADKVPESVRNSYAEACR